MVRRTQELLAKLTAEAANTGNWHEHVKLANRNCCKFSRCFVKRADCSRCIAHSVQLPDDCLTDAIAGTNVQANLMYPEAFA